MSVVTPSPGEVENFVVFLLTQGGERLYLQEITRSGGWVFSSALGDAWNVTDEDAHEIVELFPKKQLIAEEL